MFCNYVACTMFYMYLLIKIYMDIMNIILLEMPVPNKVVV